MQGMQWDISLMVTAVHFFNIESGQLTKIKLKYLPVRK